MTRYPSGSTYVYFIQCGQSGPVKIGWTANIKSRINDLQVGNPEQLHLRAVIEGVDVDEEARIQHSLWGYRIRGEWFWPVQEVQHLLWKHAWPRREVIDLTDARSMDERLASIPF